jgi:hypothetical protein
MLSSDGHVFDRVSLSQGLDDPEVTEWLKAMGALVPKKRSEPPTTKKGKKK